MNNENVIKNVKDENGKSLLQVVYLYDDKPYELSDLHFDLNTLMVLDTILLNIEYSEFRRGGFNFVNGRFEELLKKEIISYDEAMRFADDICTRLLFKSDDGTFVYIPILDKVTTYYDVKTAKWSVFCGCSHAFMRWISDDDSIGTFHTRIRQELEIAKFINDSLNPLVDTDD